MVGVKGGRALRQREGDDSHSRFFFWQMSMNAWVEQCASVRVQVYEGAKVQGYNGVRL